MSKAKTLYPAKTALTNSKTKNDRMKETERTHTANRHDLKFFRQK